MARLFVLPEASTVTRIYVKQRGGPPMRRAFQATAAARAEDVWYDAERELIDALGPKADEDFTIVMAAFPLDEPLNVPIHEIKAHLGAIPTASAGPFGPFPDPNNRRPVSLGFVGGRPISAFVGTSGFVACMYDVNGRKTVSPAWWLKAAHAFLSWSASFYEAADYGGQVGVELELKGLKGIEMKLTDRAFETGTALEEAIIGRATASVADLQSDPRPIALAVTAISCAGFGFSPAPDELGRLLDR